MLSNKRLVMLIYDRIHVMVNADFHITCLSLLFLQLSVMDLESHAITAQALGRCHRSKKHIYQLPFVPFGWSVC